jgi:hypothetical protein
VRRLSRSTATSFGALRARFVDPAFDAVAVQLDANEAVAWNAYSNHRESPRTRKAGAEFVEPDYDPSIRLPRALRSPPRKRAMTTPSDGTGL